MDLNNYYKNKYLKYKHKYLNLQNHTKHIKHIKGGIIPIPDKTKLIDCYIASSHNTYLNGHQITGKTDVDCYYNFIKYLIVAILVLGVFVQTA